MKSASALASHLVQFTTAPAPSEKFSEDGFADVLWNRYEIADALIDFSRRGQNE